MWKDIFLQKYHETINLTDRFSQRHRSSKIFPDLLIWGRDGKSLNCHMIHRKLLYNSSLNCKPTGRVIVLDNCHNHSNHNVSHFVAYMGRHFLQRYKFNLSILLIIITCKKLDSRYNLLVFELPGQYCSSLLSPQSSSPSHCQLTLRHFPLLHLNSKLSHPEENIAYVNTVYMK